MSYQHLTRADVIQLIGEDLAYHHERCHYFRFKGGIEGFGDTEMYEFHQRRAIALEAALDVYKAHTEPSDFHVQSWHQDSMYNG